MIEKEILEKCSKCGYVIVKSQSGYECSGCGAFYTQTDINKTLKKSRKKSVTNDKSNQKKPVKGGCLSILIMMIVAVLALIGLSRD